MSPPRVLILGAGLGGLTLAQSLRKRGVEFEIFEKDEHMQARAGGWAIALHSILDELKASLPEDVPALETTNHLLPLDLPAELCFYDGGPKKAFVRSTAEKPIIRANRQKLREVLASGIDVQWDSKVVHIEESEDEVRVVFDDGREVKGDVLVGADGASSFVRTKILPSVHLSNLPAGVINGEVTLSKEHFENQLQLAHSAYVAASSSYHLYVGLKSVLPNGAGADYYWYLNFYDHKAAYDQPFWTATASKQEMYDFAIQKTASLDPRFSEIVRLTNVEGIRAPPIVFRDLLLEELPGARVTLLGDAAHPMAPFRGEGGRHAFEDALRLAKLLSESKRTDVASTLRIYEEEMLPRGRGAVERSRAVLDPEQGADMTVAWGKELEYADVQRL